MRSTAVILSLMALAAAPPAPAQEMSYEIVDALPGNLADGGERTVQIAGAAIPQGLAVYGPFRVIDPGRAALVDVTDARSPAHFARMLRDYPAIGILEMIECPGTEDDLANLRLGAMIRENGIATHVPAGGSVRSGGVELFLAGARRYADPGAEFAVHSWIDDAGREPGDYAVEAPENRRYIGYYIQMGMSPAEAMAFYAMTNSVPFESARWFGANEMAMWIRFDRTDI